MINLITIVGEPAKAFYLEPQYLSDFKALLRTVTSGRVMLISTQFRSDLFYYSENSEAEPILKLWALYAKTKPPGTKLKDFIITHGDKDAFCRYFQDINALSVKWQEYRVYKKSFQQTVINDQENPLASIIVSCDKYLTEHPSIDRSRLIESTDKLKIQLNEDTFNLAMQIINKDCSN